MSEPNKPPTAAPLHGIVIPRSTVLAMLGGQWPDSGESSEWPSGFAWDAVDHFEVEDGVLVPYVGGHPAPGPDLRLIVV